MSCLFTFVREGMMYVEFNSVTLFTVLYSRFLNCVKDVSKVTAQPTILEYRNNTWQTIWYMQNFTVVWGHKPWRRSLRGFLPQSNVKFCECQGSGGCYAYSNMTKYLNSIDNYKFDDKTIFMKAVSTVILCRRSLSEQPTCIQGFHHA